MNRFRSVTVAVGAVAALGLSAAAISPALASTTTDSSSNTPFAARAPEAAFHPASANTGPAACTRPNGTVSAYVHCYNPDQLRAHYGLGPLASSNDGAGQTIVLVDSYGSPTAAHDIATFASTFGGPTPNFDQVFPLGQPGFTSTTGNGSGQSGPVSADGWAGEANLDIEWAYSMAPKAHIVLLATPVAETQGVQGLPNLMKAIDWAISTYPKGTVFSMSFGTDESAFAGAAATQFARFDQTFKRGIANGDTFFSSAGDNGSIGVTRAHRATATSPDPQVSYPNVSPYVTSVGGTQVQDGWTWDPTQDVPFLASGARNPAYWNWTPGGDSVAVWNEGWASIGTGGGLSTVYPRPAFQNGVSSIVGNHRGVPDLAWNAAVNGGVLVFHTFFPSVEGTNQWSVYGGTSAASPQAAALTAIANQARAADHKGPIGDLNTVIYAPGFDRAAAFADVTAHQYGTTPSGDLASNRMWDTAADGSLTPDAVPGYATTSGYDLTTGWGEPRAPGYIDQLVAAP